MANCNVSLKSINVKHIKIHCADYEKNFHGDCVKLSEVDIENLFVKNTVL